MKHYHKLFGVVLTLLLCGCSTNLEPSSISSEEEVGVPEYTGMTLSDTAEGAVPREVLRANDDVSGDSPYVLHKNEEFYFVISFNNPNDYEIQSFTINGKKYANYMFEDGSNLEKLFLKSKAGTKYGDVSYTIDAIKYIDGEKIKDVKIKGKKTVETKVQPYRITLDANGGELDEENIELDNGSSFELPTPTRKGYSFEGWALPNGELISDGTYDYWEDISLTANWSVTNYSIQYELNGGHLDVDNPSDYTINSQKIEFASPTKDGYSFEGWFDADDHQITNIPAGSVGNVKLFAHWTANKYNLTVSSSNESKGSVSVTGEGYMDENITLTATPNSNCVFVGWFDNEDLLVSASSTYEFVMRNNDVDVYALFWTEAEQNEWNIEHGMVPTLSNAGKTVTYGLWSQSVVTDSNVIDKLNNTKCEHTSGYFYYDGELYSSHPGMPHDSDYVFENGDQIVSWERYWFKLEPIEWDVVNDADGKMTLISDRVLEYWTYDDSDRCYYDQSGIRYWLNNVFLDYAFMLNSDYLLTTTVDNSSTSGASSYTCEDTNDKVFMLSYNDMRNSDYGYVSDESRYATPTDYARARGIEYSKSPSTLYNCRYWTRTPFHLYGYGAIYVTENGVCANYDYQIVSRPIGVRPAITIASLA